MRYVEFKVLRIFYNYTPQIFALLSDITSSCPQILIKEIRYALAINLTVMKRQFLHWKSSTFCRGHYLIFTIWVRPPCISYAILLADSSAVYCLKLVTTYMLSLRVKPLLRLCWEEKNLVLSSVDPWKPQIQDTFTVKYSSNKKTKTWIPISRHYWICLIKALVW